MTWLDLTLLDCLLGVCCVLLNSSFSKEQHVFGSELFTVIGSFCRHLISWCGTLWIIWFACPVMATSIAYFLWSIVSYTNLFLQMGSSLAGQDAALLVNLWARPDCIDLLLIQSLPKSNLELPLDALQNSVKKFVFFSSRVFTCRFGLNFNTSYKLALLVTASLACSSWALRRIERPWFVRIGTILSGKRDSISHTRCTCDWGMPLLEAGYGTVHFWRLCP